MAYTREQWIELFLGAGLAASASRLASSARPTRPPTKAVTQALLTVARDVQLPEDDDALPDALVSHAARFLASVVGEPNFQAARLEEGADVAAEDQMLALADELDAIARANRQWSLLLDKAEDAEAALIKIEADERVDADTKLDALVQYNNLRIDAEKIQTRVLELEVGLRKSCKGLVGAAKKDA
jgi:hypothetical protein